MVAIRDARAVASLPKGEGRKLPSPSGKRTGESAAMGQEAGGFVVILES
jgi:hypothetical protein